MTADEYPVLSTDKLFRLKQVKRGEDNYSKILIIYSPKESFDEALFFLFSLQWLSFFMYVCSYNYYATSKV